MRTIAPVILILAIGTAGIMWSLSGFGLVYGTGDPVDDIESGEQVNKSAENLQPEEDESFSTSNRGGDSFVGSVISAGSQIMSLVTAAVLLPMELQRIGLPQWFALPLGLSAQTVAFIGFLQFVSGRVWE